MINFETFIGKSDRLQIISVANQLRILINQEQSDLHFPLRIRVFERRQNSNRYLYAMCRDCKSKFSYKFNSQLQMFTIIKAAFTHNHSIHSRLSRDKIKEFIKQLPESLTLKQTRTVTLHSIPISRNQFYYFYHRLKTTALSYHQFVDTLNEAGYYVQSDPFPVPPYDFPRFFICIFKEMKEKFRSYSSFLNFDLTYYVIEPKENGRSWKLGVFMTLSRSRRLVPVGLVITLEETKEAYFHIFRALSQIMGIMPKVLVTDQAASIRRALIDLKMQRQFDGEHILDSFHLLRNIRNKLSNKDNIRLFSKLVQAENDFEFQDDLQDAYTILEADKQKVKEFRFLLDKSVFAEVVGQLRKIFSLEVAERENEKAVINRYIKNRVRSFTLDKESGIWQCSCKYSLREGIPCSHQLKMLLIEKHSFREYVIKDGSQQLPNVRSREKVNQVLDARIGGEENE